MLARVSARSTVAKRFVKMANLSIPIHDLDTQGKDFVFALDQAWLERVLVETGVHGDVSQGPGAVEVHAQRNGA